MAGWLDPSGVETVGSGFVCATAGCGFSSTTKVSRFSGAGSDFASAAVSTVLGTGSATGAGGMMTRGSTTVTLAPGGNSTTTGGSGSGVGGAITAGGAVSAITAGFSISR